MALTKGDNSYVTVAEADAYFNDRLDVAAWSEETDELQKARALITATSILDNLEWTGAAVSVDQSLAFPRSGCYFDPRAGAHLKMSPVPKRIEVATFELAYHLLNNDGLLDDTGSVESLQVGPISLKSIESANKIPSSAKRQINPLLLNGGARTWYRRW
jgi:hypothetical protein